MVNDLRARVLSELGKIVLGREKEAGLLLVSLLAGGHALLEGVPGVSKTLLARAFSRCLGLDFGRVQFTPDMLPLDVVGGFVFNLKEREFEFRRGPVFTNILLADELNRTPPKVQSSLLEAMQERQVTVDGHTEKLPAPHMVVATQNPFEFRGVYPLPEGQIDRFMVKVSLEYPTREVESAIIRRNMSPMDDSSIAAVVSREELLVALHTVEEVKISDEIIDYISRIAERTRNDSRIALGASPRAMVHLAQCSRANAYLDGRNFVIPDDIKTLGDYVLTHRLRVAPDLALKGDTVDASTLIKKILDEVTPPR
ncbi:MAG TPA: MoxR family ATPase [Nitrososphaerales archaeon]